MPRGDGKEPGSPRPNIKRYEQPVQRNRKQAARLARRIADYELSMQGKQPGLGPNNAVGTTGYHRPGSFNK
jgi:hypothetical protein